MQKLSKVYGLRTLNEPEPSEASTNKKKTPFLIIFIVFLKNFRLKRNSDSHLKNHGSGYHRQSCPKTYMSGEKGGKEGYVHCSNTQSGRTAPEELPTVHKRLSLFFFLSKKFICNTVSYR